MRPGLPRAYAQIEPAIRSNGAREPRGRTSHPPTLRLLRLLLLLDLPLELLHDIRIAQRRDIAEGREFGDVTTLRDPDVMKQLEGKVQEEQKAEES